MTLPRDEGVQALSTLARRDGESTPDGPELQGPAGNPFARLHGREDGQTTVIMALFLATFLFGFVALGIDVEYLFHAKRMAQGAADAAALAAAEQWSTSPSSARTAAYAMAKLNGFDNSLAKNPAIITINAPPTSGSYTGASSNSYIEAIVSQPIPTFFMQVLNHKSTVTVSARAVAAAGLTSPTCICLEATSGVGLDMSGGAHLSASGCGTTVNSDDSAAVKIVGSAEVSGLSLGIFSSTWSAGPNVHDGGSIDSATKVINPIATRCSPPLPKVPTTDFSKCMGDPLNGGAYGNGGSAYTVGPGLGPDPLYTKNQSTADGNLVCYNSLNVGANGDKVTLNPGIYVINGGQLHFTYGANNASNLGGNGVFFYLRGNASLVIDNGANVNLTAPTSGAYSGVVIFQDPADTQAMSIAGGSNTSFNGSIYAPSSDVTLSNGSNTAIDADLVAKTLTMNGGGTLNSTPAAGMGTLSISVSKVAE